MTDVEGNLALRRAGFTPLDHFTLSVEGWAAYVHPLERQMTEVLARHPRDPDAEEAANAARREFAMFRENRAGSATSSSCSSELHRAATGGPALRRAARPPPPPQITHEHAARELDGR